MDQQQRQTGISDLVRSSVDGCLYVRLFDRVVFEVGDDATGACVVEVIEKAVGQALASCIEQGARPAGVLKRVGGEDE